MNANNAIGKSFTDIRDLMTPEEKQQLALAWSRGVSKNMNGIDFFLRNNLVECISPRRLAPRAGFKSTRHILCTRNFWLAKRLAQIRGLSMSVAHPRGKKWYKERGLLLVWDIVYNDWRMIDVKNPTEWRIMDFVPFSTDEQFQQVANLWTTHMKKTRPDGAGARNYCNLIRKGV